MAEDKKLEKLIINELTKTQYEALGDNVNEDEIYVITDDEVEIKSDGETIVGNGTTATPLAISPEFIKKVNTEISDRETAIESLQEQITANSETIIGLGNNKVNQSSLGIASGVATLDANAKVPLSQINDSLIGNVNYQGLYDASTNTPNLDTVAPKGHYYITSVRGTAQGISFEVGDWIISNGTSWDKVDNTDAVSSVNGRTGNVVITKEDIDLSEYVKSTDYAGQDKAGVIKTSNGLGMSINATGYPLAVTATKSEYDSANATYFIGKGTLENIKNDLVKRAVTENDITLTDEEKTAARTWIGAGSQTELNSKASKTELETAIETLSESIGAVGTDLGTNYVKKSGDTMTGDLTLFGSNSQDHKHIIIKQDNGVNVLGGYITNSGQGLEFGRIKGDSNSALYTMSNGSLIGFYPNGNYPLGASSHPWPSTYTKKLNNGADLDIPTVGGTLARIEDIPHVETLPEATAENINKILQYVGETSDTATQGYFYKNVGTESVEWSGMLMLNTSTQAEAQIIVDSSKLLAQDPLYSGNGSCVLQYSDGGWVNWDETFEGETKPVTSLEVWGVSIVMLDGVTYTPQAGDYIRLWSETTTSYAWEQITVQESFPDQTNNAGKFLTTDGTTVSWSDKPLVNNTDHDTSIGIGSKAKSSGAVVIGTDIQRATNYSVTIGYKAATNTTTAVAIGANTYATNYSIALGSHMSASAEHSIQIGASFATNISNTDPNTFKVYNGIGNFELMSSDGTIPTERLASDGTAGQVLKKAESGMVWSDLLAEHVNITIGSETTTVESAIETINSKIPEAASSTNLLVDKATLDNAINSFEALPDKTNNNGKVLATDGTDAYWTDAFVKPTDYATDLKAGISKVNAANGIAINSSNTLAISQATVADIEAKTNQYNPITPAMLDYAVKAGILANSMTLSAAEKLLAQEWLGFSTVTMRTWK